MTAHVRIAVAGAGAWGINYVRVFAGERALRVVCDTSSAALERVRRLVPDVPVVQSFDDVLRSDVDAIVIATPAVTHADLACRALASGKHVLVEKPLALTVEDAQRVVDASRSSGRVALVGHLMLYHPGLTHLRGVIESGELGRLRYLHSTRVNLGRLRQDENALWSFGPHDVSMFDYLLPERPTSVTAQGGAFLQPGIEDVVFMTLRFPNGTLGHIHLSWLNPRKERRLTIVGSQKMAELDDMVEPRLKIFDRGYDRPPDFTEFGEYLTIRHGGVRVPDVTMEEPLRVLARHFLDCCRGAPPRSDVTSGLRVVEVLAAAQKSLASAGKIVEIPHP